MLIYLLTFIAGAIIGAVIGVLFGRRNVQHVEAALADVKTQYANLVADIKKKAGK